MALFTLKEHINTLAPTADDKLWVVQHNLGQVWWEEERARTGARRGSLPASVAAFQCGSGYH